MGRFCTLFLVLVFLLCFFIIAKAGEVCTWIDEKGVVHFSDGSIPPGEEIEVFSMPDSQHDSSIYHDSQVDTRLPVKQKKKSSSVVPPNVLSEIRQKAASQYPNDYEMQEYVIKKQVKAYLSLQNYSAPGIPKRILDQIRREATSRYPDDYEMQEYVIKKQLKSYRNLHLQPESNIATERSRTKSRIPDSNNAFPLHGVPIDVLNRIKQKVAARYPDNYSLQKILIDGEIKSYLELNR